MRSLIFIAAAAILAGAATAAVTDDEAPFIAGLPLSAGMKKAIAARFHEAEDPVRGRRLAETAICKAIQESGYCGDFKTTETCPSPKCLWSADDNECGSSDTASTDAMGAMIMGPMLMLVGKTMECGEKKTEDTCNGACKWNAGSVNTCGITEATLTPMMNTISDSTLRATMTTSFKCSMVYPVKADCDAQADCQQPVGNATSTSGRKLLGSTGATDSCEAKPIVTMIILAKDCPTEFAELKKEALANPNVTPAEKAELEQAEKTAAASPTSPAAAPWASLALAVAAVLVL